MASLTTYSTGSDETPFAAPGIAHSPVLPPELYSHIFDHFVTHPADRRFSTASGPANAEARQVLASCTLVCRAWHATSSERLFSQLVIVANDRKYERRDDLKRFAALAQTSPRLQAYATCLSILGPLRDAKLVMDIVDALHELCELRLYDCHLGLPNEQKIVDTPARHAALRTLILDQPSTGALTRALLLFPNVTRLFLSHPLPDGKSLFGHTDDTGVGYIRRHRAAQLETIYVGGLDGDAAGHITLLRRFTNSSILRDLAFFDCDPGTFYSQRQGENELAHIDRFIGDVGRYITHLTLDMSHLRCDEDRLRSLEALSALHSLHLEIPVDSYGPSHYSSMYLARLLDSVPSGLRSLQMALPTDTLYEWTDEQLRAIALCIDRRLHALIQICIQLQMSFRFPDGTERARKMVPSRMQNIVCVEKRSNVVQIVGWIRRPIYLCYNPARGAYEGPLFPHRSCFWTRGYWTLSDMSPAV